MNSWFWGSSSPQVGKGNPSIDPNHSELNETAAFNSFVHHWQQAKETLSRSSAKREVLNDDVTVIINHFGKLIDILLVDLRHMYETAIQIGIEENSSTGINIDKRKKTIWLPDDDRLHTPIFDHFMGEQILSNILQWSLSAGEYVNTLKLELLKAYELLLSEKLPEILVYKPITRPLLSLLQSCSGCVPVEVERRLVVLLNQLCDSLMNNPQLLEYFFHASEDQGPTKFLIFSLLLPFIHREGSIGQQARDALLLCMSLSASHSTIGEYIAQHSNFCPVLAAGLSGLYSMLPRKLKVETDGWYRLSKMDVSRLPELQMFINSLEFCNAVVIVSHPLVRKQLVEFLYQGFLVPVLGPALCQNANDELRTAIAYIELFIRTVSECDLRRAFLALLLSQQTFTDLPLVSSLISHLHSPNLDICLVTLSLFNTLISLHSEDVMVVLIFQYLTPCAHVMLSQRSKVSAAPFHAAERFLRLMPTLVQYERLTKVDANIEIQQSPASKAFSTSDESLTRSSTLSDYLEDVHCKVALSSQACLSWTWLYNGSDPPPSLAVKLINMARITPAVPYAKPRVHSDPTPHSLPHHANVEVQFFEKERSSSLPAYIVKDANETSLKPSECDKIPLRFSIFDNQSDKPEDFKRVINSKGKYGGSTQKNSLLQRTDRKVAQTLSLPQTLEIATDDEKYASFGESSGYESFIHKNSEESSPMNSTKGTPRSFSHGAPDQLTINEKNKPKELDQEFLDLLENSEESESSLTEVLHDIDEVYSQLSFSESSCNDVLSVAFPSNVEEDSLPWLNLSLSSEEDEYQVITDINSPHPKPTIGPFLEVLIKQVEEMLDKNLHCTFIVMDCLTQLACYPTPLLSSLLLQPSLVLQPAIRSLFQVLGKLKQKIDNILTLEDLPLLMDARNWLYTQFFSDLQPGVPPASPSVTSVPSSPFAKDPTRRSFSKVFGAIFNRGGNDKRATSEIALESIPDGSGYRYKKQGPRLLFSAPPQKRHAALCAVVLREWILELSACAQEHTVRSAAYQFESLDAKS